MKEIIISSREAGQRLDRYLGRYLREAPKSFIYRMLRKKNIVLNGKKAAGDEVLAAGDGIRLWLSDETIGKMRGEAACGSDPAHDISSALPAENGAGAGMKVLRYPCTDLDILYEDNDLLIINKPKGMVVHPAAGHYSGTLVNAVLYHCKGSLSGINGVMRPGIVHRIDKDTTGSIIICKNDAAHQSIARQLAEHSIVRRYRAIVLGNIRQDELTISQPIGRDPSDRKKMAVRPDGKQAVTHVRVLERFGDYTYVECRLETGRTHQIRVHMAWARHPLLGDTVYGSRKKSPFTTYGQCLHAMILGFVHPAIPPISSPVPSTLAEMTEQPLTVPPTIFPQMPPFSATPFTVALVTRQFSIVPPEGR